MLSAGVAVEAAGLLRSFLRPSPGAPCLSSEPLPGARFVSNPPSHGEASIPSLLELCFAYITNEKCIFYAFNVGALPGLASSSVRASDPVSSYVGLPTPNGAVIFWSLRSGGDGKKFVLTNERRQRKRKEQRENYVYFL